MIPRSNGKKYEMGFDGAKFSSAMEDLKSQIRRLNRVSEIYADLSQELDEKIESIETVEAIIGLRTGFRNMELAADALGVKRQYSELKKLLSEPLPPKEAVTNKGGQYVAKEAYLDKLKESFHTYLPVEMRKIYDDLEKACELINEHGPWVRNAVVKMPDNSFSVNIHRINEAQKYQS